MRATAFEHNVRAREIEKILFLSETQIATTKISKNFFFSARRFGMVAIAGELAGEGDITGWAAGDAAEACKAVFLAWLAQSGTTVSRRPPGIEKNTRLYEVRSSIIGAAHEC